MDVTVLYMTTARPFDGDTLRASLTGDLVVLVEPYLAGTSSAEVAAALADMPHRIAAIGVPNVEHRTYGTWQEHNSAHGLDARGIRTRVARALTPSA
jgi:transketolase